MNLLLDGLLVLALLWSAWRALASPDLARAVVLFIVFGLLMALAWARLNAPDIALAEAAIGAGLTGALLLDALGRLQPGTGAPAPESPAQPPANRAGRRWTGSVALVAGLLAAALAYALFQLPAPTVRLPEQVAANMAASGVDHPVTAVLLNFRGYDTLLEVAVLLIALIGLLTLGPAAGRPAAPGPANPLLKALARLLVPLMILSAGYLLWAGAHRPGGAFQAGALLAAAAVLLHLAQLLPAWASPGRLLRLGLAGGFLIFLGVAAALLAEGALLTYPPAQAGGLILLIEAGLTVSLGLILAGLFLLFAGAEERP